MCGLAVGWSSGCNDSVVVELQSGPQSAEISASAIDVPASLRDGATLTSLPCPTGECPSTPQLPLACRGGVCDPEPVTVSTAIGDVVDFDVLLRGARTLLRFVDAIEIVRVQYSASPNSLTVDVPDIEVFFGPEGAAGIDAPGVARLGVIPALPAGATREGEMVLDASGSASFSNLVLGSNRRVRFFAKTSIDLHPGGPIPAGSARVTVNVAVRAIGRIVD